MALGASSDATAWSRSGRLGHLAGSQASGADPDALGCTVDQCTNGLKVGLKTPRTHIVRVRDGAPDNWSFSADFTSLRHGLFVSGAAGALKARSPSQPKRQIVAGSRSGPEEVCMRFTASSEVRALWLNRHKSSVNIQYVDFSKHLTSRPLSEGDGISRKRR